MAMPSSWRSPLPAPKPAASGASPKIAVIGIMHQVGPHSGRPASYGVRPATSKASLVCIACPKSAKSLATTWKAPGPPITSSA